MRPRCVQGWSRFGCRCLVAASVWLHAGAALAEDEGWRDDWAVAPGFSLSVDTKGYRFPTSIVFVPEPGPGPKDPLYFVAELRGTIKVVTNDRSVHTFADDLFSFVPPAELPDTAGSVGLFGLCLAPEQGYLYATFAVRAEHELFENRMIRFEAAPQTFAIQPEAQVDLSSALLSPQSRFGTPFGHQAGGCQVQGDRVLVGVGDGEMPHTAQDPNTTLGKVLRMTLDGEPVPQNPFYTDDGVTDDNDFVWARGFRNPFGLVLVDGRLFVADNGPISDRFLEAKEGGNFLFDGSDLSIATNSIIVFPVGRGLGQVVYEEGGAEFLPERLRSTFFLVHTGVPEILLDSERPEIVALSYDLDQDLLLRRPETLVRYAGSEQQALAALALGPDGLYFAPVLPDGSPTTAVYKLRHAPDREHPVLIAADLRADMLMARFGCLGCHVVDGEGASRGPPLGGNLVERLEERLNSADYAERVRRLNAAGGPAVREWAAERQEVLDAEGLAKVRKWLTYRIMEPRFDDPDATMPSLGLSEAEAAAIARGLSEETPGPSIGLVTILADLLFPRLKPRHLVYFFIAGVVGAGVVGAGIALFWSSMRRRRHGGRA